MEGNTSFLYTFGLWSQGLTSPVCGWHPRAHEKILQTVEQGRYCLLCIHVKPIDFSSLPSYADQYISCAMQAKQRSKITEQVSSCYLPLSLSKMVSLVNMILKHRKQLSPRSFQLKLSSISPVWETSWGKRMLLLGEVLLWSAGGAHPVVYVGPDNTVKWWGRYAERTTSLWMRCKKCTVAPSCMWSLTMSISVMDLKKCKSGQYNTYYSDKYLFKCIIC